MFCKKFFPIRLGDGSLVDIFCAWVFLRDVVPSKLLHIHVIFIPVFCVLWCRIVIFGYKLVHFIQNG